MPGIMFDKASAPELDNSVRLSFKDFAMSKLVQKLKIGEDFLFSI